MQGIFINLFMNHLHLYESFGGCDTITLRAISPSGFILRGATPIPEAQLSYRKYPARETPHSSLHPLTTAATINPDPKC